MYCFIDFHSLCLIINKYAFYDTCDLTKNYNEAQTLPLTDTFKTEEYQLNSIKKEIDVHETTNIKYSWSDLHDEALVTPDTEYFWNVFHD